MRGTFVISSLMVASRRWDYMSDGSESPNIVLKPWRERSNTAGLLPGKGNEQLQALRTAAMQLPLPVNGSVNLLSAKGSQRSYSCEAIFLQQLSRNALVLRTENSEWIATDALNYWLRTEDDLHLAKYLHANIKFFGELLALVGRETRTSDLLNSAKQFGLHWTSADQVHRRLAWMQSLGVLERWGFGGLVVNDRGREFLSQIELCSEVAATGDNTASTVDAGELAEPGEAVSEVLAELDATKLTNRKVLIGYIPRGTKTGGRPTNSTQVGVLESLRNFVELLGEGASTDEFFRRASEQLGQKRSSFTQSMHTFRHMRMIEMVAFNRLAPTRESTQLLQSGNEVDLVRFLHSRYRFIGELLDNLPETKAVAKLVEDARNSYGCAQIDNAELRTRLGLLTDAGLVERIDWTRYRATPTGRLLATELPLEMPIFSADGDPLDADEFAGRKSLAERLEEVRGELRRCSRLSDASREFELAVAGAFELFGFRAEHLGGSSRTDVLVTVELSAGDRFRSIVDAKASATGIISDNLVNFDALKVHRRNHRADFGMVVGPDFSARVKEFAADNMFALLTVNELIGLLERHQQTPLTLLELRGLFQHSESDLAAIEEQYDNAQHAATVLTKLVDTLYQEANDDDPVAGGYISLEQLNFVLRKEVAPRPTKETIEQCLQLLSSQLVRAVAKNGDKQYKLVDSPVNVMRRLSGLGLGLASLSIDDGRG